jgi:hypothetical protein
MQLFLDYQMKHSMVLWHGNSNNVKIETLQPLIYLESMHQLILNYKKMEF